jgi:small subunit ribosomal protein S21
LEVVIKIEVKDNNVDQALRVLKRKLQREGFFRILKIKSNYEKPSERKKREKQENIKRSKKMARMRRDF